MLSINNHKLKIIKKGQTKVEIENYEQSNIMILQDNKPLYSNKVNYNILDL